MKYTRNGNNFIIMLDDEVLIYLTKQEFLSYDKKQFHTSPEIRKAILDKLFIISCVYSSPTHPLKY